MSKKKQIQENTPTIAPGMNDDEELNEKASKQEIKQNNYTSVTTLSYDEVDES
ncbi:hypothetical protein H1Z61_17060 [Bacillus aquiflavi]|uniref:Uncharacterized protein n=1 Tax=Bacillus aquiflavi TaxID=2672567 RepID=A0A7W2AG27_9BACI|nr:hypothetical protein [Bacillus aquiflavi]MBA4538789.1 hypothetical protein [Bacillus aquiflavi]UAC49150.1 hypothetical protein K6959_04465 [Bacillus aquiflavi]